MGIKPTIKGLGSVRFGSVLHFEFGSVRFDTSSSVRFQQQGSSVRFGSARHLEFCSVSAARQFGSVRFDTSSSVQFQQQGSSVPFGSVRRSPKIGLEFGVFGYGSVRFRSPNLFTENYAEARGFACV